MDLGTITKLKSGWDKFTRNHPKFPAFLNAIKSQGVVEGTVFEIKVTNPGCDPITGNIKLTAEDLDLFKSLLK